MLIISKIAMNLITDEIYYYRVQRYGRYLGISLFPFPLSQFDLFFTLLYSRYSTSCRYRMRHKDCGSCTHLDALLADILGGSAGSAGPAGR